MPPDAVSDAFAVSNGTREYRSQCRGGVEHVQHQLQFHAGPESKGELGFPVTAEKLREQIAETRELTKL